MHPVNHLFEDIYRNYWGISQASGRPEGRPKAQASWTRDLLFRRARRAG
ncbi:MAG: hypothetical protein J0I79_28305 [Mesorhizobium sp.]|nr:hypothetical protein [Mesorhizobium sp.]MBN9221862.1 hypothetical protein [Mesorhizobium sp.]